MNKTTVIIGFVILLLLILVGVVYMRQQNQGSLMPARIEQQQDDSEQNEPDIVNSVDTVTKPKLPVCGDGACEKREGISSCPADCGGAVGLSNLQPADVGDTYIEFEVIGLSEVSGSIEYGISETYEMGEVEFANAAQQHRVRIDGLQPGTGYYIKLNLLTSDGTSSSMDGLFYETLPKITQ